MFTNPGVHRMSRNPSQRLLDRVSERPDVFKFEAEIVSGPGPVRLIPNIAEESTPKSDHSRREKVPECYVFQVAELGGVAVRTIIVEADNKGVVPGTDPNNSVTIGGEVFTPKPNVPAKEDDLLPLGEGRVSYNYAERTGLLYLRQQTQSPDDVE